MVGWGMSYKKMPGSSESLYSACEMAMCGRSYPRVQEIGSIPGVEKNIASLLLTFPGCRTLFHEV
jgi:hypothetical protein